MSEFKPEDAYNDAERERVKLDESDYAGTTRGDVEVDDSDYAGTTRGTVQTDHAFVREDGDREVLLDDEH